MSQRDRSAAGTPSEVDELVRRLSEINEAIAYARGLGVPAPVPTSLYEVCAALVAQHDEPVAGGSTRRGLAQPAEAAGAASTSAAERGKLAASRASRAQQDDRLVHEVPLRRLLWQVITPGEEFTVTDVVGRLERLGVPWPANKVSNALGYWVSRNRLDRCRKGVYLYPLNSVVDDDIDGDVLRDTPVGLASRAPSEAGGKERHLREPLEETRQAM